MFALEMHPSRDPATDGALLRLFLDFELRTPTGVHRLVAHEHEALAPAFALIGRHVEQARMTARAGFELCIDDGSKLIAGSLDERDYWEFQQPWEPDFRGRAR